MRRHLTYCRSSGWFEDPAHGTKVDRLGHYEFGHAPRGWLLIDCEHAPNDLRSVLAQLQAVAAYPGHPIVRTVDRNPASIKQLLDIGVQTLLVPMVDTPEEEK